MPVFLETASTLTNTTVTLSAKRRRGLIVGNPSDTVMTVAFGSTATATNGVPVAGPGSLALLGQEVAPDSTVSVFCAGTSKAYYLCEW